MHQIADMSFGKQNDVFFKLNLKCMMNKYYYILVQLAGIAICNIGKGPEWFHPLVVKALFNKDVLEENNIPEIHDLKLKSVSKNKKKIVHGIYDDISICLQKIKMNQGVYSPLVLQYSSFWWIQSI